MNAARHCSARPFRVVPLASFAAKRNESPTRAVELTHKGISFLSNAYTAPLTEVEIRLRLPTCSGSHVVHCAGVVVECHGTRVKNQYLVVVAFLGHPEDARHAPLAVRSSSQARMSAPRSG